MALALNNLKRVDMPLNKETKPKVLALWEIQTTSSQSDNRYPMSATLFLEKKNSRNLRETNWCHTLTPSDYYSFWFMAPFLRLQSFNNKEETEASVKEYFHLKR